MMRWRPLLHVAILFIGTAAAAQPRPIFDLDDFVDPRKHDEPAFVSRLVLGGASGYIDHYRPSHHNTGFLDLANSLYWGPVQVDYKLSKVSGKNGPVSVCGCAGHPIYFPTPPSADSTPSAPPSGLKQTAQFAVYHAVNGGPAEPPVMLRYRLSVSWQPHRHGRYVDCYGREVKALGPRALVWSRRRHVLSDRRS